jgi:hypothetical protein
MKPARFSSGFFNLADFLFNSLRRGSIASITLSDFFDVTCVDSAHGTLPSSAGLLPGGASIALSDLFFS